VFSDSSARSRSISGDSLRSGQAQPSSPPRAPPGANAPGMASLAVSHHSPGAEGSPARSKSSSGSRRSRTSQRSSKCYLLKFIFLYCTSVSFKKLKIIKLFVPGRQNPSPRGPTRPPAASATETHGSPTAPTRPPAAPAVGQPPASISQPPESPKQPRGVAPVDQTPPVGPPPGSPPRLPHHRYQGTLILFILCTNERESRQFKWVFTTLKLLLFYCQ